MIIDFSWIPQEGARLHSELRQLRESVGTPRRLERARWVIGELRALRELVRELVVGRHT